MSTVSNIEQGEYRTLISGPFYKCELYNDAGDMVLSQWLEQPPNLDNCTQGLNRMPFQQEGEGMATKINRTVTIDGVKRWIHANSEQEYANKLAKLFCGEPQEKTKHLFSEYAWNWFETYSKPNTQTATQELYKRLFACHIMPALGEMALEDIKADALQRLFNAMDTSKETKLKVKRLLNQIFKAAVDDDILVKNPTVSSRLKITGTESTTTAVYSVEQMQYLIQHIGDVKQPLDRAYIALQALHPLRLEEVLGLKWADIDMEHMALHIDRAVTHPTRNQPEVKATKTMSSVRTIGLSQLAVSYLTPGRPDEFVLGGGSPLSYTQVRRMCERIQKDTGFTEKVTPKRFRTTVLTDLYDQTRDIKLVQAAAGHSTADMTLKHYVKGRGDVVQSAVAVESVYTAWQGQNLQKICKARKPEAVDTSGFEGCWMGEDLQI